MHWLNFFAINAWFFIPPLQNLHQEKCTKGKLFKCCKFHQTLSKFQLSTHFPAANSTNLLSKWHRQPLCSMRFRKWAQIKCKARLCSYLIEWSHSFPPTSCPYIRFVSFAEMQGTVNTHYVFVKFYIRPPIL